MDNDGQRLLDVINDPNALENFLGDSNNAAHHNPGADQHHQVLTTATAITQEQLVSLQQQIQQQQAQLAQLQQLQQQQIQQQHFQQQAVRSPAQPQQLILRSPAGPPFPPASPSSLASSPAPSGNLSHPYSPAPAQSPGPAVHFYRAAPSPQQQRSSSLSSTPVASPINYPPGPGPGSNGNNGGGGTQQAVQLPTGTITIPGLSASTGSVQQLVSTPGGQVLQIISAPAPASSPQLAGSPGTVTVRQSQPAGRLKQPQLRPKPANSNNNAGSSPGPTRDQTSSPRMAAPVAVQQQQQQHVVVQQPQQQPSQQQHATGQMVQLGAGGPTGTLVFSGPAGGNAMFPALAPTGGQFFLQPQAGGGGFQLIVRPPPAPTPPSPAQQAVSSPANVQQQRHQQPATIVMQPQLGPTVLNHRPSSASQATVPHHQPTLAHPMVRLVTLPGLGTVQLQQIQTPNGPAFLAVQQPQPQQQPQPTFLRVAQPTQTTTYIQQQPQQQDAIRLVSSPGTATVVTSKPVGDGASDNNTQKSSNTGPKPFASPPAKKPAAKKKPPKKKAKEIVEEKRPPVQVNLAELMKQTGIVDDDESFFMLDDDPQPPPPQPLPTVIQPPMTIVPAVQTLQLETKENTVMQPVDGPMLSETNLIQTLHQHGLALSADDLHTLRNFIKPNSESSALIENDRGNGGINGIKEGGKPLVAGAAVSLTLSNGQVIQLTEPFEHQQQPKPSAVQFVTFAQPVPAPVEIHVQQQQQQQQQHHHGFQNEFLEDLARSQIVSDPKKGNKNNKTIPQAKTPNNNNIKKKAPPKKKNASTTTSASPTNAVQTVVTLAPPTTPTSVGTGPVQRVQTIKLSPQNQQNLRNIQAQIQYLNSKKDPSPQDTSLLQKLIEHHQKILATGKPVPTIPGQHAQGVPFNTSVTTKGDDSQALSLADPPEAVARGGVVCQGKSSVIPANIQQNVHLANLLRQPVPDKSQRVTTSTTSAPQTTTVRLLQSGSSGTTTTSTTTNSTIQSPIGTLVLTVVDGEATAIASSPSSATAVATESTAPQVGTDQQSRGIKRPAAAAAPPKASIAKSTLFEHQLKTDQSGAVAPDCHTPFKNKTNACKRLVRYHVFHELDMSPAVLEREEEELEDKSQQLLSKFHQMINKYHHLLLMESRKEAPASEYVMVERMFVGEEKLSLERLKEEARVARELQLTPVLPELKTEPMDEDMNPESMAAAQAAAVEQAVNGLAEELSDQQLKIPKVATLKFTRNKEGEGYKTELRDELQVDGVLNKNNCRIDNHSIPLNDSDFGKQQHQPYDEWEAIQRELALYPESRDHKDDMDFLDGVDGGGIVYDEDIKAQMQNAIDDLIRLNGCDDIAASTSFDPSRQNGSDQYNSGNSEGQVDLALNEAVNSIL